MIKFVVAAWANLAQYSSNRPGHNLSDKVFLCKEILLLNQKN